MSWAVIDWGVGGAAIYRELKRRFPRSSITYFSDSGFTPYGKVPAARLAARLGAVVGMLRARGVTRVIVACNAASTVLAQAKKHVPADVRVLGVIEPVVQQLAREPERTFGVIGGRRTVRSGIYGRLLRKHGHRVRQRIAQPLSAFVEAGELDSPRVRAAVEAILAPLSRVDALVLACTHYPALMPHFRRVLPRVRLVDPAVATGAAARRVFGEPPRSRRPDLVLTTGKAKPMRDAAYAAFGVRFGRIREIEL